MMRAHVNNFMLLLRPPVCYGTAGQRQLPGHGRRLFSDVASVAAVKAAPVEARPPLTDLLGRKHDYLRISLTERCNLRCQYCMPAEGVPLSARAALLSRGELARLVRALAALGVRKVRLTGGEPTLRADLADIIQDISSVEGIQSVAMTTNGLVLTRRLVALQRAGLSALNVSLDSLRPDRYEHMARRPGLPRVLAGVDLALQLGYRPVKINVVLMKGFNDDEIGDFVEYTRDREVEIRFIEFMPFAGNAWDDSKLVPHRAAVRALLEHAPDAQPCLPRPNDTARVWKVPGYAGSVGFISSMTNNFCSSCNRLRLTADGNLKVCLFGAAEVSLRDALRAGVTDLELEDIVRTALKKKKPQHAARAPRLRTVTSAPATLRLRTVTSAPATSRLRTVTSAPAESRLRTVTLAPAVSRGELLTALLPRPVTPQLARGLCSRADDTEHSRGTSNELSHLDGDGRVRMVDVGDKEVTVRTARAECLLRVSGRVVQLLRSAGLHKGDALTVAQLAGVMAAKRTSELIPLCHALPLDCVRVRLQLPAGGGGDVTVTCDVRATARTGAEMEALTGAAVAALALYDMCKSVDRNMRVSGLRVLRKTGGRTGDWPRPAEPEPRVREHDTTPHDSSETYVPTNVMNF